MIYLLTACAGLFITSQTIIWYTESINWLDPKVHSPMLSYMNLETSLSEIKLNALDLARLLETVFTNQGYYNLFLAIGTAVALILIYKNRFTEGRVLIIYTSIFAVGAALILYLTTSALTLAIFQAGPAILTLITALLLRPQHRFAKIEM